MLFETEIERAISGENTFGVVGAICKALSSRAVCYGDYRRMICQMAVVTIGDYGRYRGKNFDNPLLAPRPDRFAYIHVRSPLLVTGRK